MQQTIKSFSQLSNYSKRDFIQRGKLKPLDRKFAVSVARQLATGFENIDLRHDVNEYQYRKARKIISEFFEANTTKTRLVRPSKSNRAAYAEYAAMSNKFKVYPMPINTAEDKFEIKKRKGKKKIVRRGKFIVDEDYYFPDRIEAMENPIGESEKLLKQIKDDYGDKITQVHIKVGAHQTNAVYSNKIVGKELEKWSQIYEHFDKFVMGLKVYSFDGQQAVKPKKQKVTKAKNTNAKKYQKAKGR